MDEAVVLVRAHALRMRTDGMRRGVAYFAWRRPRGAHPLRRLCVADERLRPALVPKAAQQRWVWAELLHELSLHV